MRSHFNQPRVLTSISSFQSLGSQQLVGIPQTHLF